MVSSQSLPRPALNMKLLPSPTLLDLRDVKLQEIVEPRKQLLPTECLVSCLREGREDFVKNPHLDSPMMGD